MVRIGQFARNSASDEIDYGFDVCLLSAVMPASIFTRYDTMAAVMEAIAAIEAKAEVVTMTIFDIFECEVDNLMGLMCFLQADGPTGKEDEIGDNDDNDEEEDEENNDGRRQAQSHGQHGDGTESIAVSVLSHAGKEDSDGTGNNKENANVNADGEVIEGAKLFVACGLFGTWLPLTHAVSCCLV
jgi:hypothetical protein